MCSRRRNLTPTDAGPPASGLKPSRSWSGASLCSIGAAGDREESQEKPPQQLDDGDGNVDTTGGCNGDVELLPEPTHRGYGSLEKIYPHCSTQDIDRLRLFDRAIDMFVECIAGTRDQTRINSQTFRSFVRSVCMRCFVTWVYN